MGTSDRDRSRPNATIPFGRRRIAAGRPTIIIAEIGINHEGSAETAARLIEAAAASGADAIKLQTVDADANYVRGTESHTLFSQAALTREETARLFAQARSLGVEPLTTCGDFATLDWVEKLNPAAHKISSGLMTNVPLVRYAARTGRSLIISSGMAEIAELDRTVDVARREGAPVAVLQCTSLYPCPDEYLNLAVIGALAARYGVPAGFSDHSDATDIAAVAVAAGACVIEKHFTLDRGRASFDHALSLEPDAFAEMVRGIRRAETLLGSPEKQPVGGEKEARARNFRCLVAACPISAGEVLTTSNVALKRPLPGTAGLPAAAFDETIGKRVRHDLNADTPISSADIED